MYFVPCFNLERFNFNKKHFIFRLQLELVSNAAALKEVSHTQSNTIYAKDYYVLVMDNLEKVRRDRFVTHEVRK